MSRSIKYYTTMSVQLYREKPEGVERISAKFRSVIDQLADSRAFNPDKLADVYEQQLQDFNQRGSDWRLESVENFTLYCAAFRPAAAKGYFPLPPALHNKGCCINIKNNDNYCFLYCCLAAKDLKDNPNTVHLERESRYIYRLNNELNIQGLQFPLSLNQVQKFETLNPQFSVSVYAWDDKEVCPLVVTKQVNRKYHVNLLLLKNSKDDQHYVLIRNLSRLVAGRTKREHATHVCPYCLHPFRQKETLDRHVSECQTHPPRKFSILNLVRTF